MRKCFLCYGESADGALVCRWCNQELPPLRVEAPTRPVVSVSSAASPGVPPLTPAMSAPFPTSASTPRSVTSAAGVTDGRAPALRDAITKIDRISGFWNWHSMAELDRELTRLHESAAGPVGIAIHAARASTADKTWALASLYVLLSVLLTPLASWLLALYSDLMRGNNLRVTNNPAFVDIAQGAISFALVLPLWLANKLIKTRRKPLLNPRLFPLLILLGLVLALEYLWFFAYFYTERALPISAFLAQVGNLAGSRWLYPWPFVVITINLLMAARFTYISDDLADAVHGDGDFVGTFGVIVVAMVSLAVSAVLRVLLWLLGVIF